MNNRNLETQKFEIEKPYVIICEGKDDFAFFGEYLKYPDKLKLIDKKFLKSYKLNDLTISQKK